MKKGITSSHFLALRRRLDALGYKDLLLGTDSAPLAQQMLEDLVNTTEMLRESDETINSLRKSSELGQMQIEPLQAEAQKLMRENVQLHQQLIAVTEEKVKSENVAQTQTFQLQAENRRIKTMNQKVLDANKELKKQLETAQANLKAQLEAPSITSIAEVGERNPRAVQRRSAKSRRSGSMANSADQSSLASTQNQLSELQEEVERLNLELQVNSEQTDNLRRSITDLEKLKALRDEENDRLGKELVRQTGRDGYMLTLQHENEKLMKENEKLAAQVRVINPSGAYSGPAQISPTAKKAKTQSKPISSKYSVSEAEILDFPPIVIQIDTTSVKSDYSHRESFQSVPKPIDQSDWIDLQPRIDELEGINSNLEKKIQEYQEEANSKSSTIAQLISDLAVIHDSMEIALQKKDEQIKLLSEQQTNNEPEIFYDTEQVDKLERELNQAKAEAQKVIQEKDQQIQQLQVSFTALQNKKCENCLILQKELEEEKKNQKIIHDTAEEERLKSKLNQLETLVMVAQQEQRDVTALDEQIQNLQRKLTEKELELSELQSTHEQQKSELQTCRANYDEAKNKIYKFPSVEQNFRSVIEQMRAEYKAVVQEAKEKARLYENSNQRYLEAHKQIYGLQMEVERLRGETEQSKEEASFHRTKGEEYVNFMNAKHVQLEKETQSQISLLQRQLNEKNRECESFKKLLSDARRQLANVIGQTHKNRNSSTIDLV